MSLTTRTDAHQTTMRGDRRLRVSALASGRFASVATGALLAASAAVHVDAVPTDTHAAGYLGVVLAAVAAVELAWVAAVLTRAAWAFVGVAVLATGDLVGFLVTRTVGMPQAGELVGRWGRPGGLIAVGLDLAMIAVVLGWRQTAAGGARNESGTTK